MCAWPLHRLHLDTKIFKTHTLQFVCTLSLLLYCLHMQTTYTWKSHAQISFLLPNRCFIFTHDLLSLVPTPLSSFILPWIFYTFRSLPCTCSVVVWVLSKNTFACSDPPFAPLRMCLMCIQGQGASCSLWADLQPYKSLQIALGLGFRSRLHCLYFWQVSDKTILDVRSWLEHEVAEFWTILFQGLGKGLSCS